MAAADYTSLVQSIYVSYFGRPADTFGLANFAAQLDALKAPTTARGLTDAYKTDASLRALIDSFGASAESTALYGSSTTDTVAFVSSIYQNLLNRAPDFDGLVFWTTEINAGRLTRANASLAIMAGATDNTSAQGMLDAQVVATKVTVASNFTTAIDTGAELAAYTGTAAAATARGLLAQVTAATVPAEFQATVDATIAAMVVASAPTTTTNLVAGIDTLAGTTANDTFNALSIDATTGANVTASLGAFDNINGGAGTDTLNIFADSDSNLVQQGTVANVEIINIFNEGSTAAAQFGTTTGVDASKFVGATQVWQAGPTANKVINLGNSTTAGFRGVSTNAAALDVAASGAVASVALANVTGNTTTNVVGLNISGSTVSSVDVSGTMNKALSTGAAAKLALNVTTGADVETLTVNTGMKTTLTFTGADVSAINASASTGGVTFVGTAPIASISTGSGADVVSIATALSATVKTVSLTTGAGDDELTINVDNAAAAATGNTVTVDAGAGDDSINLTIDTNVVYNVTAGAGDDTVSVNGTVKTTDVIDGGEGFDTISLSGAAAYVAGDYITFNKVLKGFEGVEFTTAAGGTTAVDASQIAGYKSFNFEAGGQITKVAADQMLTTSASLTATASGYGVSGSTVTYAGTLNITAEANATITAKAQTVNLTVVSAEDAPTAAVLNGDFKTAVVTLENGVNSDDSFSVSTLTFSSADVIAATSLTLTGNGTANVTNAAAGTLTMIDASGLASVDEDGVAVAGLILTSTETSAETIKLGSGIDNITLSASTYGTGASFDTVTGLNLVLNAAGTALTAASDDLTVSAMTAAATKFTTAQTDFQLALTEAAAATSNNLVFAFGGDTYVFVDAGTAGSVDAADTVVKLTGTVNLDALILALGTPA